MTAARRDKQPFTVSAGCVMWLGILVTLVVVGVLELLR